MIKEKGFKYWFTNVFWYHYKAHCIVGLILLAFIAYFVYERATAPPEPDFMVAVVTGTPAHSVRMQTEGFRLFGDMEVNTHISVLLLSESDYVVWQQLMITLVNESYALYLMDDTGFAILSDQLEGFYDLEDFGIKSTFEPRIAEVLLPDIGPLYAMIRKQPENPARAEAAAECLIYLLDKGGT